MHDLFDMPVEPPRRRKRSAAGLGSPPAGTQPTPPPQGEPSAPAGEPPATHEEVGDPLASPDLTPREILQRYFAEQAIPCVDADKVKAGLFSRERLQMFDFVVHREEVSWLLAACDGQPHDSLLSDLREWERILGPGFLAVVADIDDDEGTITFRTIDGEKVDIA